MEGFQKLTVAEMVTTSGGFAFMLAFTFALQAIAEIVGAIKLFSSDAGTLKTKNLGELKWSQNHTTLNHASFNPVYYID